MRYTVSCHCGDLRLHVEGELKNAMACNCSMCQRKGSLLWFVGREQVRMFMPEARARSYLFNKHHIRHRFCGRCGIHPYAEGRAPDGKAMIAVNVRCIENIELDKVPVIHHDGRAH